MTAALEHPEGTLDGHVENIAAGGASFATETLMPEVPCGTRATLVIVGDEGADAVRRTGAIVRLDDLLIDGVELLAYALVFDQPVDELHVPPLGG